jgi:hypothetical protein
MAKSKSKWIVMATVLAVMLAAPSWAQAPASQTIPKVNRAPRGVYARHHHDRPRHRPVYNFPPVYYPYGNPYYSYEGVFYPYGLGYWGWGYPIDLSSGLQRGFKYGDTWINPNFGN